MGISVTGSRAMITSPHHLASMAGAQTLQRGGNAFDAAIAISACLGVVYPHMTGLGGDSFWMTYSASEGRVRVYNATGRAGYSVNRMLYDGEGSIPSRGVRSAITVPGMVDGWAAIAEGYGRLPWGELFEPAIAYAEQGFPLSADQHANTALNWAMLKASAATSRIYAPGNEAAQAGSRFVQRDMAGTLKLIAERGREVFYQGELAKRITEHIERAGGYLTFEDFASHTGYWTEPLKGTYRGHEICQAPPNSQGFAAILALQQLERFSLQHIEHGSFEYYHLLVESLKLAFRDRNEVLTDPEFASIPLDKLLSPEYAAELAARIDMRQAGALASAAMGGDTAYAAVVDDEGNAVSFIQSLYFEFGSGEVAGDTGVLLQNRGSFFSLDPKHPNRLEPGKRTFHTLMPAMALRDGKPAILYGTQGGEGQPQTQTAILTRMIDYGMNPQNAIEQPRFVWGRTWGEASQALRLESRIDPAVVKRLGEAGHDVRVVGSFDQAMGHAGAIRMTDEGFLQGGTDPRSDGAAIGW
ncbi:gamma-glutamyltransferase [Paenibacillus albus]|uniref:Glutathione hydrolase proenzyme n=1 Tax=Paenibacillus albus TaxID=2495582 RepID=A0A3S8ZXQ4_9BACL|nr:gamma-glutamyltransferase [Paenibacillus albus]AZN38245.1 gamma-glutamyltransferase [Paenibacillus albus]